MLISICLRDDRLEASQPLIICIVLACLTMCMCWQSEEVERLVPEVAAARKSGDPSNAPIWAGSSVGLIKTIEHAEDVVRDIAASAARQLKSYCQPS